MSVRDKVTNEILSASAVNAPRCAARSGTARIATVSVTNRYCLVTSPISVDRPTPAQSTPSSLASLRNNEFATGLGTSYRCIFLPDTLARPPDEIDARLGADVETFCVGWAMMAALAQRLPRYRQIVPMPASSAV